MFQQSRFRVLVAVPMDSAAGRKKLNGIHRFLSEGYDWDMELIRSTGSLNASAIASASKQGFDGILVCCIEDRQTRAAHLNTLLPSVLTDYPDEEFLRANPFSVFLNDDPARVIQKAVQHLTACGRCRCYAYVPTRMAFQWSDERHRAFSRRLADLHIPLWTFEGDGEDRDCLKDWLLALPKPAAILAAFDDRAYDVLASCHAIGLRVPDDIAVLGIGNDEPICESCIPPLSSIAVDFEEEGRLAARELHAMMLRRRRPSKRIILVGARDIAVRESTLNIRAAGVLSTRALAYIEKNLLRGITPKDVVQHLHVSRSLADLRFKQTTGRSLQDTILTQRLDRIKSMLSNTDDSIAEIAVQCGYRNANYLKNLFKRKTGVSMRTWRKEHITDHRASQAPARSPQESLRQSPRAPAY